MKVEKCPRCGKNPISSTFQADNWILNEIICFGGEGGIHQFKHSRFKILVILKWNRWARREAKRIEKEKK